MTGSTKIHIRTAARLRHNARQAVENKYLLEQIPDFYDLLKSSYDEAFYQQEALGKYLNVQDRPGLLCQFSREDT